MSDYGLNFGFRRSDESSRSAAEGRYKTPVGSALALGTAVEIDPANDGRLKQSAANPEWSTGFSGLLLQELDFERSIYESGPDALDSSQKGVAKANRLAVITSGPGTKVWFKNTPGQTRADGRVIAARTLVDNPAGLAVGDHLGWDGAKWAKVADATTALMKVTYIKASANLVEAALTK